MLPIISQQWVDVLAYRKIVKMSIPFIRIPVYVTITGKFLLYFSLGLILFLQACILLKPSPVVVEVQYEDVVQYSHNLIEDTVVVETNRDMFLKIKHTLTSETMIKNKVSRLDQLSNKDMVELNQQITESFIQIILNNAEAPTHVLKYFIESKDLNKIETALMEQTKYNIPASIKLAQSALETAYGTRIIDNNYFGIKGSSTKLTTTTEYYTPEEFISNKKIIQSYNLITRSGKPMYKCIVKDSFSQYNSPWESFRDHSIFLSTNKRYAPLFTKGKNYEDWADKIGSTKYGGVGYATSPIYGEILKQIIKRYHLDLLDY